MKNILLTIEYDGTNFVGWQRQPEGRTVQGELEQVLSQLCCFDVKLNGTSRTDAGVHAFGQAASFQGEFSIPVKNIQKAANNLLACGSSDNRGGDIRIKSVKEMPLKFHARFNCRGKTYVYKVITDGSRSVFSRNYSYFVEGVTDIQAMKKAAEYMKGTHDFKCFEAAGGTPRESTVRCIHGLQISEKGSGISFAVTGDGFLYNMVRIIIGTLIDVGQKKISPESIPEIIASRDRQKAGHTAPPQGLYLSQVYF